MSSATPDDFSKGFPVLLLLLLFFLHPFRDGVTVDEYKVLVTAANRGDTTGPTVG